MTENTYFNFGERGRNQMSQRNRWVEVSLPHIFTQSSRNLILFLKCLICLIYLSEMACWHCGDEAVYYMANFFEDKAEGRHCCYNYPRCQSLVVKKNKNVCDLCNRDEVDTYLILYPDQMKGNRFCARCISVTNGLRNTRNITIVDKNDQILSQNLFPHPNDQRYRSMGIYGHTKQPSLENTGRNGGSFC